MTRGSVWLVVTWACLAVAAPAAGQGLGDASKKEKQRREKSADTVKSYSDDDLEELDPIANDADAKKPAAPVVTPTRGSSGRQEGQRPDRRDEEDRWRTRVAQARGRVDEERSRYEHAASLTLVPGYALVDDDNRIVASSVEELQENTARAKARLEAAEKTLADLLETARRQGVPPGWLR